MPKKKDGGVSSLRNTVKTCLLVAAAFIDSGIAVAAGPIIGLQIKVITIPSGYHLAFCQLLFVLPQLVSTQVVEHLSAGVSTLLCLVMTLLFSSLAIYVQSVSFSSHALSIFCLSRLLTGLFRHEKMLFQKAGAQNATVKAFLPYTSWLGPLTGLIVGGIAGDVFQDAIVITEYYMMAEGFAACLVALAYLLDAGKIHREIKKVYYSGWLREKFQGLRTDGARLQIVSLVLVTFSQAANQCQYALDAPLFDVSFLATGAHMVLAVLIGTSVAPRVRRALPLSESGVRVASCLLLYMGCHGVPLAANKGVLFYVAYSALLVDLPSGVLTHSLSREIVSKDTSHLSDMATKFVSHLILIPKLFAAPFRMCLTTALHNSKASVCAMSCPCVAFVLVCVVTRRLSYAVAVGVAACAWYLSSLSTLD
ncbi:hypothetical protein STCU_04344 [Strigomonas culicis]|uniref:Uncharacterized protein n=1 Tax=Strigomonas culicis TaxID=28005 RepID=S9UFT6_9TRYP|nr:hypothetical protein STCU_08519 [Strigomonas culicis]EPY28785.1 hypothetical protein STCU_04882 [Strigomonas culicis]EPY29677.1 hypothetical protein STCU_04344 [Strigomonas culicis]|eukprot:EPY21487.1 hypothetical protein STCU_08519 [Strigomonas culicis]